MKHRLLTLLSALSLLMCIGVVVLWVRNYWSYWGADALELHIAQSQGQAYFETRWGIYSDAGVIEIGRMTGRYEQVNAAYRSRPSVGLQWETHVPKGLINLSKLAIPHIGGFGAGRLPLAVPNYTGTSAGLMVPHWFVALVTAILPLITLIRWRRALLRRHRALLGLCLACGYDLRASTERCPECGAPMPQPTQKAGASEST
jgi:hypothetical protein